jgi:hypothetical protein
MNTQPDLRKIEELQIRISKLSAERQKIGRQSFDRRNYDALTNQIWRLRKELSKVRRGNA